MPADPFAPLKTWEGTSPGPWRIDWDENSIRGDAGPDVVSGEAGTPYGFTCAEDACHIQVWDPDTCREVVGLLVNADSVISEWQTGDDGEEWLEQLAALLARLGGSDV